MMKNKWILIGIVLLAGIVVLAGYLQSSAQPSSCPLALSTCGQMPGCSVADQSKACSSCCADKVAGQTCPRQQADCSSKKLLLCSGCGQIKGSALCCQPGATKCTACGLVKGSPGCCAKMRPAQSLKMPQKNCPIMGGAINKDLFADYQGKRIYFCCKGCVDTFAKDPAGVVQKLQKQGIELESSPPTEKSINNE